MVTQTMPRDFSPEWVRDFLPHVLPPEWRVVEWGIDGAKYMSRHGQTVIVSGNTEADGKRWLHVSTAHPRRLPTWEELRDVKDLFIGKERLALQVLPQASRYINIHAHCLHLWHCIDGEPVPDFARGGTSI